MIKNNDRERNNGTLSFVCFDVSLSILLPNLDHVDDLLFWLDRFCPGVRHEKQPIFEYNYQIECIMSKRDSYKIISENKIKLYSTWNYNYASFLAKYITQVFQKFLNLKGMYIVPAACISKKNNAVLFIGDFWQGKTSAALNTVARESGLNIISDNYVIIKDNVVLCGTKYISLSGDNISRYKKFVNGKVIKSIGARKFFRFESDSSKKKLKICGIIIPYINIGDKNFYHVSDSEAIWYLYQKLSRLITGETIFFNGNYPSPNLDNQVLSVKRLSLIKKYLYKNLYYASSSIDRISDYSIKIINKKNGKGL